MSLLPPPQTRIGFDGFMMVYATTGMGQLISTILIFLHGIYALHRTQNKGIRFIIVFTWIGTAVQSFSLFSIESSLATYNGINPVLSIVNFTFALLSTNLPNILLLNIFSSAFAGIGDVFGKNLLRLGIALSVVLSIGQLIASFYPFNLGPKALLPSWIMNLVINTSLVILYSLGLKMLLAKRELPTVRRILNRFLIFYIYIVINMIIAIAMAISYIVMYTSIPNEEWKSGTAMYRMPLTLLPFLATRNGTEIILRNNIFVSGNIFMANPKEIDSSNSIQMTQVSKQPV